MERNLSSLTVDWIDAVVWRCAPDVLRLLEGSLRVVLLGPLHWHEILGELPDETLAYAIQKKFLSPWPKEELLANRYRTEVCRWCLAWSNHRQDAEDFAQEFFLKCWGNQNFLDSYDPEKRFLPFFSVITRNAWLNTKRGMKSQAEATDPSLLDALSVKPGTFPEILSDIHAALSKLPREQEKAYRSVLGVQADGSLGERMEAKEVAQHLHCSIPAVYSLVYRAKLAVIKSLQMSN